MKVNFYYASNSDKVQEFRVKTVKEYEAILSITKSELTKRELLGDLKTEDRLKCTVDGEKMDIRDLQRIIYRKINEIDSSKKDNDDGKSDKKKKKKTKDNKKSKKDKKDKKKKRKDKDKKKDKKKQKQQGTYNYDPYNNTYLNKRRDDEKKQGVTLIAPSAFARGTYDR